MNVHEPLNVGHQFADDAAVMHYALQVARQGFGYVEPNPAVGAVIVNDALCLIAEGYHQKFGTAHAEVNAIRAAHQQTRGQQMFVSLEPCSHTGKTPPCADAVIAAEFQRVVIGCSDPAPHVSGQGIQRLRLAGINVDVGVCGDTAQQLIAPFRKLQLEGRPWVHAKWAMTLDGRIATRTGHSKWITNEESRAEVHRIRGGMDAIITGAGTVRADNPTLTARPAGPRTPLRVVVDSDGTSVSSDGNLIQTRDEARLLLCVRETSINRDHCDQLATLGVEVLITKGGRSEQIGQLLTELGQRRFTNVLVEAGAGLMGSFFDDGYVDEVHAFIAAKIAGGEDALSPVGGIGRKIMPDLDSLAEVQIRNFGTNVLIEGRLQIVVTADA